MTKDDVKALVETNHVAILSARMRQRYGREFGFTLFRHDSGNVTVSSAACSVGAVSESVSGASDAIAERWLRK